MAHAKTSSVNLTCAPENAFSLPIFNQRKWSNCAKRIALSFASAQYGARATELSAGRNEK
jgi:hypothetical protein